VKRNKAFLRHILTSKDKKRKRQLGGATLVSDADTPKVKRMIPY
jgi:large subunit ribosomal protein L35